MGEVYPNRVLGKSDYLPDADLALRVDFRERGRCYCAVWSFYDSSTGIYKSRNFSISLIRLIDTNLRSSSHPNAARTRFYTSTRNPPKYLRTPARTCDQSSCIRQTLSEPWLKTLPSERTHRTRISPATDSTMTTTKC